MKCGFIYILIWNFLQESRTMKTSVNFKGDDFMVIEEDEGKVPRIVDDASYRQDFACSLGSSCIPLSQCHLITQLLKRSCLQTDKLRGLTCGYQGSQPMVCCPQTCPANPPSGVASECGKPQIVNWWNTNYIGLGSHPWAVRVGFKNKLTNSIDYLCGGSVINKRTVLTAAHCALAKTATHKIVSVRVGEYDSQQDPDCSYGFCAQTPSDVPINHIVVHPKYDSNSFANNIALLILKTPLNFSVSVQPICIYPKEKNYIFVNRRAILVGWGKLSSQVSAPSTQQQLAMPVQPLESCLLLYGSSVPISENELCVGGEGKDACSGFGGSPLVLLDPSTRRCYYQIGLLSFGSDKCGELGIPSIYTRVDKYADWIDLNSPKA